MEHLLVPLPPGGVYVVHNGILGHGACTVLDAVEAQSRVAFCAACLTSKDVK